MQLPPTSFFGSRRTDDEEALIVEDASGQDVEYDLTSNSFLNHAARNLPTTMLGWHYRSRSESLISFSNAAFYQGRLLTVPEVSLPPIELHEITVRASVEGARQRRPPPRTTDQLSFHRTRHLSATPQRGRRGLHRPSRPRLAGRRNRREHWHHRLFRGAAK